MPRDWFAGATKEILCFCRYLREFWQEAVNAPILSLSSNFMFRLRYFVCLYSPVGFPDFSISHLGFAVVRPPPPPPCAPHSIALGRESTGPHGRWRGHLASFSRLITELEEPLIRVDEDKEVTVQDTHHLVTCLIMWPQHPQTLLLCQPCHRSSVLFLGTWTPLPFCFGPPFPLGFCTCQKGPCLICCRRQILFWWLSHSCLWWYGELAPEINGGFCFNTQEDASIQNNVLWCSWQVICFAFWSQWSAGEGLGGGAGGASPLALPCPLATHVLLCCGSERCFWALKNCGLADAIALSAC